MQHRIRGCGKELENAAENSRNAAANSPQAVEYLPGSPLLRLLGLKSVGLGCRFIEVLPDHDCRKYAQTLATPHPAQQMITHNAYTPSMGCPVVDALGRIGVLLHAWHRVRADHRIAR